MERILKKPITRREFLLGSLFTVGAAIAGCAAPRDRQGPQIPPELQVDATDEEKTQASKIYRINQGLIDEFINKDLVSIYQININQVDMKTLSMFRKNPYGYMIPSDAVIGSYRNLSMVAVLDNSFDKDEKLIGSEIAVFTPLMGEPLPEYTNLGIKNDTIPAGKFIEVANLTFNLPSDVKWGSVHTVNAGNVKQTRVLEGEYALADGRQIKITVTGRGSIRLKISNL